MASTGRLVEGVIEPGTVVGVEWAGDGGGLDMAIDFEREYPGERFVAAVGANLAADLTSYEATTTVTPER